MNIALKSAAGGLAMAVFSTSAFSQEQSDPALNPETLNAPRLEAIEEGLEDLSARVEENITQEDLEFLQNAIEALQAGQENQLTLEQLQEAIREPATVPSNFFDSIENFLERNSLLVSLLSLSLAVWSVFQGYKSRKQSEFALEQGNAALSQGISSLDKIQSIQDSAEKMTGELDALLSGLEDLSKRQETQFNQEKNMFRIFKMRLTFMRKVARQVEIESRKIRASVQGQETSNLATQDTDLRRRLGFFPPNFRYFTQQVNSSQEQVILQLPFATFGLLRNPLAWSNYYGTLFDNFGDTDRKSNKSFLLVTYKKEDAEKLIDDRFRSSDQLETIVNDDTKFEEFRDALGPTIGAEFERKINAIYPDRDEHFFLADRPYSEHVKEYMLEAFTSAVKAREAECFAKVGREWENLEKVEVIDPKFDDQMVMFVDGNEMIEVEFRPELAPNDRRNRVECLTGKDNLHIIKAKFETRLKRMTGNNLSPEATKELKLLDDLIDKDSSPLSDLKLTVEDLKDQIAWNTRIIRSLAMHYDGFDAFDDDLLAELDFD